MRTTYPIVCAMWLFVVGNSSYAQGTERKFMVTQSDFVINQAEASKFSNEVLSPIVFNFVEKESEPEALRVRIRAFLEMIRRREINYVALPAYYPIRKMHVLAKLEQFESKPTIILFVPEVRDSQATMSPADFEYDLLITLAHEMIHLELGHNQHFSASEREAAKDEANAWAKTIVEIIRPLQAKGLPTGPYLAELSACFQRMKDHSSNPKWVKLFMPQ